MIKTGNNYWMRTLHRVFYIYTIQRVDNKTHVWRALNRNYKPLGFIKDEFVTYSNYPIEFWHRFTQREFNILSVNAKSITDADSIYLYDDSWDLSDINDFHEYSKKLYLIGSIITGIKPDETIRASKRNS